MNDSLMLTLGLGGGVLLILLVIGLVLFSRARARGRDGMNSMDGGHPEQIRQAVSDLERSIQTLIGDFRKEQRESARELRGEVMGQIDQLGKSLGATLAAAITAQNEKLGEMAKVSERQHEQLRTRVNDKLNDIAQGNERKLEDMRRTVDEKLQGTLEKRLGESFKLVSERLEAVQRGLGEMQNLASGVGDLKRVLTNVKTRGGWGEVQLGILLSEMLTDDQYATNVAVKPGSEARVEFAIRLPGRSGADGAPVWLPIDAKFPKESYERLTEAAEAADAKAIESAAKELETQIRSSAKDISGKYLSPPATTDFAIMYLPTEGLFAEVVRRPGLVDHLQNTHRVLVAGPTTFSAILNALQMGFRTLAIEKRSSEVWQVLAGVKTEFGKFSGVLGKVKKKLQEANNQIEDVETRTRVMDRTLRKVEEIPHHSGTSFPANPSPSLLGFPEPERDADTEVAEVTAEREAYPQEDDD